MPYIWKENRNLVAINFPEVWRLGDVRNELSKSFLSTSKVEAFTCARPACLPREPCGSQARLKNSIKC